MGCDIHVFTEAYMNGRWIAIKVGGEFHWNGMNLRERVSKPSDVYGFFRVHDTHRDYTLFGLLAGVRSDECTPMKLPVGLPKDISPVVREAMRDGLHTSTWYYAQELVDSWDATGGKRYRKVFLEYDKSNKVKRADPTLIQLARNVLLMFPGENIRFLIAFDS